MLLKREKRRRNLTTASFKAYHSIARFIYYLWPSEKKKKNKSFFFLKKKRVIYKQADSAVIHHRLYGDGLFILRGRKSVVLVCERQVFFLIFKIKKKKKKLRIPPSSFLKAASTFAPVSDGSRMYVYMYLCMYDMAFECPSNWMGDAHWACSYRGWSDIYILYIPLFSLS